MDVITAEGEQVEASETENPDLFWGIRGGGGNFGVVTRFEFRLNPLGPNVVAGPVFWPIEESPEVLRFYRDWIAAATDQLMTIVCCHAGSVAAGEEAVAPLKAFGCGISVLALPCLALSRRQNAAADTLDVSELQAAPAGG